jgi:hypothetical protein
MYQTPWIGLAALVAMFIIPFLPSWLFEGPRTIKHWPRQHVCGVCGAPWNDEHTCQLDADLPGPTLRGELRRLGTAAELDLVQGRASRRGAVGRQRRGAIPKMVSADRLDRRRQPGNDE